MSEDVDFTILNILSKQTKKILYVMSSIDVNDTEKPYSSDTDIDLQEYTAIIGIGGELNFMAILSLDKPLLNRIVESYIGDKSIPEDKKEETYNSATGETLNTIIGRSLSSFHSIDDRVSITTPVSISKASQIKKNKNAKMQTATLQTIYGNFIIGFIK